MKAASAHRASTRLMNAMEPTLTAIIQYTQATNQVGSAPMK